MWAGASVQDARGDPVDVKHRIQRKDCDMGHRSLSELAQWFAKQSRRYDLPLAEQLMLENVSDWLKRQELDTPSIQHRPADPWTGFSNQ
jgi:hypothetical protein